MKILMTASLVIVFFAFTNYSEKQQPKMTYQTGFAKISVWENKQQGKEGEIIVKNFVIEKVYKEGEQWKANNQFNEAELIELKEAINKAIKGENVKTATADKEKDQLAKELDRLMKEAEKDKK